MRPGARIDRIDREPPAPLPGFLDVGQTALRGLKTTEFMLTIAMIVALVVAVYVADADLDAADGWRYASWVAAAYIVSRGLAKLGTREPYTDD